MPALHEQLQQFWQPLLMPLLQKPEGESPAYIHYLKLISAHQQECMRFLTQQENPRYDEHFYRLWIAHCETCYAALLAREDYQQAYGNLINEWLRSKQTAHE